MCAALWELFCVYLQLLGLFALLYANFRRAF